MDKNKDNIARVESEPDLSKMDINNIATLREINSADIDITNVESLSSDDTSDDSDDSDIASNIKTRPLRNERSFNKQYGNSRRRIHEAASERMGRIIHNPRRIGSQNMRRIQRAATIGSMDIDARYQKLLDEKEKQIDIKVRKIENNNSWSSETEAIAVEVGEKAQGYVWMHNRNASYLVDWDARYSNVEIILSILTGTSVFTTLNDCQDLSLVTLVTGIIIYMTAVVRAIHQNRKYPERASAHRLAASKYSEIYHSVQKQLALYRRDRENAKDYINWITEKFDTLLLSSPGMDDPIKEEYLVKFKDVKFIHPGDLKQIDIKKETSMSSASEKHKHSHDNCSEFSSEYEITDLEKGNVYKQNNLKRSMTLQSPMVSHTSNKEDKKMQYELARYTMR